MAVVRLPLRNCMMWQNSALWRSVVLWGALCCATTHHPNNTKLLLGLQLGEIGVAAGCNTPRPTQLQSATEHPFGTFNSGSRTATSQRGGVC